MDFFLESLVVVAAAAVVVLKQAKKQNINFSTLIYLSFRRMLYVFARSASHKTRNVYCHSL